MMKCVFVLFCVMSLALSMPQSGGTGMREKVMDVTFNEKQLELTLLIKACADEVGDASGGIKRPAVRECVVKNIREKFSKKLNQIEALKDGVDDKVAECFTGASQEEQANCIMNEYGEAMRKLERREDEIELAKEKGMNEAAEGDVTFADSIDEQEEREVDAELAEEAADQVDTGFRSAISACGQDADCVADSIKAALNEKIALVSQEREELLDAVTACFDGSGELAAAASTGGDEQKMMTGCIFQQIGKRIKNSQQQ